MLTPITWWGGLLFIAWFGCYWLTLQQQQGEAAQGFPWMVHLGFLAPGAVLAGYFYPLQQAGLQKAYAALLALAVAVLAWTIFMDWRDPPEPEEVAEEDRAADLIATVLGYALLYAPLLVACALGVYKVWPWRHTWL